MKIISEKIKIQFPFFAIWGLKYYSNRIQVPKVLFLLESPPPSWIDKKLEVMYMVTWEVTLFF